MKKTIVLLFCSCIIGSVLGIPGEEKTNFIGLNPSIVAEPYYEKGEFDVNLVPLVYQHRYNTHLNLRFISFLNWGVRKKKDGITHIGINVALPIHFMKPDDGSSYSKGFYISPVLSITRNILELHTNFGLYAEPGYTFLFKDDFELTLGIQLGATCFVYDEKENGWGNHFSVKIFFGKWLF